MNKNKSFFRSFKNALVGLISPFCDEANLRFHFMIANLIIFFAYFFGISKAEWAILFLAIGLVITTELTNTAVENAVDTATMDFSPYAKKAKDIAAGAVLFSAIIAVIIGFCLFFDINKIVSTLTYMITTPRVMVVSVILLVIDILFLVFGGRKNIKF